MITQSPKVSRIRVLFLLRQVIPAVKNVKTLRVSRNPLRQSLDTQKNQGTSDVMVQRTYCFLHPPILQPVHSMWRPQTAHQGVRACFVHRKFCVMAVIMRTLQYVLAYTNQPTFRTSETYQVLVKYVLPYAMACMLLPKFHMSAKYQVTHPYVLPYVMARTLPRKLHMLMFPLVLTQHKT